MKNQKLLEWIEEVKTLCQPKQVHLVEGTDEENDKIIQALIEQKAFTRLNADLRPNSFLARSTPDDVARVEDRTFICSETENLAGPTNHWRDPKEMKETLLGLFRGCMKNRTMYIVPYCMGPIDSPYAKVAIQLTDSAYVVASMRLMTRMGRAALDLLGDNPFVKCLHSVGVPLQDDQKDVSWPCNTKNLYISHFPETKEVWSFGSGYGGNALLNKKSFALRIASKMALEEGWLAEHMLIVGITNPEGKKRYFAASFPSACGKTNLAMLTPTLPGWKVECVGDDIAWMHWGEDGRLYAINPESGFFGVCPGTSLKTNPNAMMSIQKNTIFTNVGLTDEGDVWWEGMSEKPPAHLINWLGEEWTPQSTAKAAHPNARFTVSSAQCPIIDPEWQKPTGVPISGIIFGGRRSNTVPLVRQALSWQHGVFLAASMTSEMTAAAKGELGKVRHDPFAMLPFCGYHMGDYFAHWLSMEQKGRVLPEIFYVNWFLKDDSGKFLWPGFGDNIRALEWCFNRIERNAEAENSPIGYLPKPHSIDCTGLDVDMKALLKVDGALWKKEADDLTGYFQLFGQKLPQALKSETEKLQRAFS